MKVNTADLRRAVPWPPSISHRWDFLAQTLLLHCQALLGSWRISSHCVLVGAVMFAVSLTMARGWSEVIFKVPSDLNLSGIL